jgi:hypothetical protein
MDPFTIALAVFGVQKLRGQSTGKSFRDALLAATGAQALSATSVGADIGIKGFTLGQEGTLLGSLGPNASAANSLAYDAATSAAGNTGIMSQFGQTAVGQGITSLYGKEAIPAVEGTPATAEQTYRAAVTDPKTGAILQPERSYQAAVPAVKGTAAIPATGYQSLSPTEKLITGAVVLPTAMAAFQDTPEPEKAGYTDEEYKKAYGEQRESLKNLRDTAKPTYTSISPYNYGQGSMYTFNQGGIVNALPRFAVGGVNYMPSKITHDENDVYNYTRASGYVEDGSGTGEKDTDTILAQLADGEFVSRTDAVLGAGIMAGASPNNMKEMRKLGASYFYDQQAKFKRIFDLLDASRKTN